MSTEALRDLVARGEFLLAYDEAQRDLAAQPDDIEIAYLAALALARSGATDRAEEQFVALGLDRGEQRGAAGRLAEDIDALFARIAKDRALSQSGERRRALATVAAQRYQHTFERHGGSYPCINAATMWLVAGEPERAHDFATTARELATGDDYWSIATRAEAALMVRDVEAADALVHAAAATSSGAYAQRATTRRQLRLICQLVGVDTAVLDALQNPPVVHYAGHRVTAPEQHGRFPASNELEVAAAIAALLDKMQPGFAYGALASGGDILIAEALLARDAELHVVLPFIVADFVEASVAEAGPAWVERFGRCLEAAATVSFAADGPHIGDDVPFQLCSAVAMGDALRQSRLLEADCTQLVVWDGDTAVPGIAGTAADVRTWSSTGRPTEVVSSQPDTAMSRAIPPPSVADLGPQGGRRRELRAVLFGDIAGFSTLTDLQMPVFMDVVMTGLARTVDRFGDAVLLRRTWGDGIHLAFASVDAAADCAVSLQQTMAALDLGALGLETLRGLRIGAHVGPVYEERDPFTNELSYMGANVTRAARVEPGTPEGEVYVTHPFAAVAELEGQGRWSCQYVGIVPAAKNHGRLPMYLLRRVAQPTSG